MIYVYHLLWTVLYAFLFPIAMSTKNKRLRERLALDLPKRIEGGGTVWIHALSVGEVTAAVSIVDSLHQHFPKDNIAVSVATRTGMETAVRQLSGKVESIFTMPVDCWWCFYRVARLIRPSMFILVETDLWPGLMGYLKERGVRTLWVNGKLSPSTFGVYRMAPFFSRVLFNQLDVCLVQAVVDRDRLFALGVGPAQVEVVGNVKFDREWVSMGEKERRYWLSLLRLGNENLIWVAGSTHEGEEGIILRVFQSLRSRHPSLRLVIAPRKVERADAVLKMVQEAGLRGELRTGISGLDASWDVVVLDTLGELSRVYGIAALSFVGGSLIPDGGHNLLEPASFGCPVLFGPYTYDFSAVAESLGKTGGGWQVEDEEGLRTAVERLLAYPSLRQRMGRAAGHFVTENQGAVKRTMAWVAGLRS